MPKHKKPTPLKGTENNLPLSSGRSVGPIVTHGGDGQRYKPEDKSLILDTAAKMLHQTIRNLPDSESIKNAQPSLSDRVITQSLELNSLSQQNVVSRFAEDIQPRQVINTITVRSLFTGLDQLAELLMPVMHSTEIELSTPKGKQLVDKPYDTENTGMTSSHYPDISIAVVKIKNNNRDHLEAYIYSQFPDLPIPEEGVSYARLSELVRSIKIWVLERWGGLDRSSLTFKSTLVDRKRYAELPKSHKELFSKLFDLIENLSSGTDTHPDIRNLATSVTKVLTESGRMTAFGYDGPSDLHHHYEVKVIDFPPKAVYINHLSSRVIDSLKPYAELYEAERGDLKPGERLPDISPDVMDRLCYLPPPIDSTGIAFMDISPFAYKSFVQSILSNMVEPLRIIDEQATHILVTSMPNMNLANMEAAVASRIERLRVPAAMRFLTIMMLTKLLPGVTVDVEVSKETTGATALLVAIFGLIFMNDNHMTDATRDVLRCLLLEGIIPTGAFRAMGADAAELSVKAHLPNSWAIIAFIPDLVERNLSDVQPVAKGNAHVDGSFQLHMGMGEQKSITAKLTAMALRLTNIMRGNVTVAKVTQMLAKCGFEKMQRLSNNINVHLARVMEILPHDWRDIELNFHITEDELLAGVLLPTAIDFPSTSSFKAEMNTLLSAVGDSMAQLKSIEPQLHAAISADTTYDGRVTNVERILHSLPVNTRKLLNAISASSLENVSSLSRLVSSLSEVPTSAYYPEGETIMNSLIDELLQTVGVTDEVYITRMRLPDRQELPMEWFLDKMPPVSTISIDDINTMNLYEWAKLIDDSGFKMVIQGYFKYAVTHGGSNATPEVSLKVDASKRRLTFTMTSIPIKTDKVYNPIDALSSTSRGFYCYVKTPKHMYPLQELESLVSVVKAQSDDKIVVAPVVNRLTV